MMKLQTICKPCLIFGSGILIYSGIVMSADGEGVTVTYEYATQALVGVLLILVGLYVKGVKSTAEENAKHIRELEKETKALDLKLTSTYQTRSDIREIIRSEINPLTVEIRNLHERVNSIR